jgi:SAM-dependent methyltransferase
VGTFTPQAHGRAGRTPNHEPDAKTRRLKSFGRENEIMTKAYVHGYDLRENVRLQDQATTLVDLLHSDTAYAAALTNVRFQQGDIFHLPFPAQSFDHVFVCFVLEHLKEPLAALQKLKAYLRPGGTITVIEGDHGSVYFHPDSDAAHAAIHCQVELQSRAGGNALIGRSLFPLLVTAGYDEVRVSPRMVYVDSSKPELVDGFTKRTFTAMIEGVRRSAIEEGLIDPVTFDNGIEGLYRTTGPDGTFCYTFFKAMGKA